MSQLEDESLFSHEGSDYSKLFQSAIDTQTNLIILMHHNSLILFNKAFQNFTKISTVKEFLREFGSPINRFVPHPDYFHAGKADSPDEWPKALMELPEQDRIISMINFRAEPHAFSVTIDAPADGYTIISFTDISQDLIKRIMIENDVSIDKESGAYNKDYFIHTEKSFYNAAEFNEKSIGITMIELLSSDTDTDKYMRDFSASIKCNIRQSDMLVRWEKNIFLLAYLVDTPENTQKFSRKLLNVMREEPFQSLKTMSMRIGSTIQNPKEEIDLIVSRAKEALKQSSGSEPTFL